MNFELLTLDNDATGIHLRFLAYTHTDGRVFAALGLYSQPCSCGSCGGVSWGFDLLWLGQFFA